VNCQSPSVPSTAVVVLGTAILEVIVDIEVVPRVKVGDRCAVTADRVARNMAETAIIVNWHSARIANPPSRFRMADAEVGASLDSHRGVDITGLAHVDGSAWAEASVSLRLHAI
jgi:hypothetical protein